MASSPPGVINFRLSRNLIKRLDRIADLGGGTRSDAARQAIVQGVADVERAYNLDPIIDIAPIHELPPDGPVADEMDRFFAAWT